MFANIHDSRVKLPKTFLAINLSDAFTFEEHDKQASDQEGGLEMKAIATKDMAASGANALADDEASNSCAVIDDEAGVVTDVPPTQPA